MKLKSSPPLKPNSGVGHKAHVTGVETRGKPVSSGSVTKVPTGDAAQFAPSAGNPTRAHYQMASQGLALDPIKKAY